MTTTTFTDFVTPVPAAWLNDVNSLRYGTGATGGAGALPFSPSVNYSEGTTGAAVQDGVINAMWFVTTEARRAAIKARSYANDNTAEIQAALDFGGAGSTILIPRGGWKVNGTLTKYAGQYIIGESAGQGQNGSWSPLSGTVLKQYSTADIPLISCTGTDDNHQAEKGGLSRIALQNSVSAATGTGYYCNYARHQTMSEVYITGFNVGVDLVSQCWLWKISHLVVSDFRAAGLRSGSASEDNLIENSQFSSYNVGSIGIHMRDACANNTFINVYVSSVSNCVVMAQGDDGSAPYQMHATFIGCLFEDWIQAAIFMTASMESSAAKNHPSVTVIHPRMYVGGGGWASSTAFNGQTFIYATHFSQINVQDMTGGGNLSYGGVFGSNMFGYFPTGTACGKVFWGFDEGVLPYGTSRFLGQTQGVTMAQGDKPICRLSSTALSYTATNFTTVPFDTVVSDTYGWASSANHGWIPKRAQLVRFRAMASTNSAPVGRYTLSLYKNGVQVAAFFDQYVSTAGQSLIWGGEFFDTPNGTTDYYNVVIYSSASFTLNNAATVTYASAEIQGS